MVMSCLVTRTSITWLTSFPQGANHRYHCNCAEINAGAITISLGWATVDKDSKGQNKIKLPAGSAIPACGVVDRKTQKTGWLNPCSATEWPCCRDHPELDKVKMYTRGLETAEHADAAAVPRSA
ncbi:hypothetical protein UCDDA912_g05914 [Diaporthe ampelina]|uniref:Uncharacterized protein n=1 Tax=Diaporthe ampelina TaxID=1214573 RepID=A0A0G2FIZ2_9PEZI|nr:hypothetical protein UCDDA912_g05914 [Diaporthe ampelina]